MSEIVDTTVVVSSAARSAVASLNSGGMSMWSSLPNESFDDKRQVLALMTNAATAVEAELVGKTINLRHVIVHVVELEDEKTGEMTEQNRVVLITEEGESYAAISSGLMRSLENIIAMFGTPDVWEGPIPVQLVEKRSRAGFRFYSLNVL